MLCTGTCSLFPSMWAAVHNYQCAFPWPRRGALELTVPLSTAPRSSPHPRVTHYSQRPVCSFPCSWGSRGRGFSSGQSAGPFNSEAHSRKHPEVPSSPGSQCCQKYLVRSPTPPFPFGPRFPPTHQCFLGHFWRSKLHSDPHLGFCSVFYSWSYFGREH